MGVDHALEFVDEKRVDVVVVAVDDADEAAPRSARLAQEHVPCSRPAYLIER